MTSDAKIGLLLGLDEALVAILLGFCIATVLIIFLMIIKKIRRNSYIPLGPFMIFGMLTYVLWGTELVEWYINIFMR